MKSYKIMTKLLIYFEKLFFLSTFVAFLTA